MLHLLLGLGNDIHAHFKSFLSERIEQLSQEEKDARDMSFLAEIRYDESLIAYDNSKQVVLDLVEQRKEMILRLSQGGLSKEEKKALNDEKKVVASKIKDKIKIRDDLDNAAKLKRKDWNDCKKKEAKAESDNKNPSSHKVTNHIETVMLKSHEISKSSYHAGDLEGNDIRRLMSRGLVVFNEIRMCLRVHRPDNVSADEIDLTCNNFSRACGLMDSIFSVLHAKRGSINDEKINTLKIDLNLLRLKWKVNFYLITLTDF